MTTADPRSVLHPAYSSPGWDWLKNPPEHWETSKVKHCLAVNESTLPETTDPDLEFRYIEISAVNSGDLVEPPAVIRFSAAPSRARRIVKGGDTIVSTVRTYLKAVWYADDPGDDLICSTGFAVLTPKQGTIPKFASYVAQSAPFTDQVTAESVGIAYPAISEKKLGGLRILVPPLEEQAAIVRFLDHADEQIRRYIASKERLIDLLEEERQALVHQAVILGLDPTVRLKPSGVEWLVDVPEHWGIRRLKTICYMKSGEGITATSIETEGEYPVYGGNGLRGYTFEFTHNGDYVLIGRQGALCGNIHVAREKFWASEHAVVATLSPNHVLEWFSALLEVMNLNQYSIAAAQPGLAVDRVMNLWAPIPPREEQAHIATRMGRQTERIDNIVNNARRQIDFMNEYRTRLIADVVTGQLDVREAAAQLLDDFSEEEPKDEYGLITDNMDHDSYDASQPPEEEPVTERETIL